VAEGGTAIVGVSVTDTFEGRLQAERTRIRVSVVIRLRDFIVSPWFSIHLTCPSYHWQ